MRTFFSILAIAIICIQNLFSANWERIKGLSNTNWISALEVYDSTIYISLYEQLFKSEDFGKSWEEIYYKNGTSFPYISNFGIVKTDNDLIIRTTMNSNGFNEQLSLSKDDGITWDKAIQNINNSYIHWIQKCNNVSYSSFTSKIKNTNISVLCKYNSNTNEWKQLVDSISNLKIKFQPRTVLSFKNLFLIGTNFSRESILQGFKSPNIYIYNPEEQTIKAIIDTTTNLWKSNVYCSVLKDNALFIGTSSGVWKSTDDGLSWLRKSEGLKDKVDTVEVDLEIHKILEKDGNLYAISTYERYYGDYYPTYTNLVYSSDEGENWQIAENFRNDWPQDIKSINDKLIISTYNGLYESEKTLQKKVSLLNDTLTSGNVSGFFLKDDKIYMSPSSSRIYVTSDLGNNWEIFNNYLPNNLYKAIMYMKDSICYVFYQMYNSQFFYVSKDYGKTFKLIDTSHGLGSSKVNTIYVDENENVYLGTKYGLYYTTNQGDKWEKFLAPEIDFPITSILKMDETFYVGVDKKGIYKSTDKGVSWTKLVLNQKNTEITITDIKYIKSKLYIGSNKEGIFVSTDFGATWEKKNSGYPETCYTVGIVQYGDYIFAGTSTYGSVFFTTNEGESWEPCTKGYSGYKMNQIGIEGDYLYVATSTGLYRLNVKDWINGVDEIEKRDYFYSYDLYPNPAHERVTAKIYWDTGLDINLTQIGIYDIYGNQIEARENIEIVQESDWSGKLTWFCAGVPFGTYFIKIDYGTETRVIKFIKI